MAGIEILRQDHTFNIVNACTVNVEVRITMFVPASVNFYLYAFEGHLPDLQAKIDGKVTAIVPYTELSKMLGVPVTLNMIQAVAAANRGVPVASIAAYDTFAVVPFEPHGDKYIELAFTWIEKIDKYRKIEGVLTRNAFIRPGFHPIPGASLYVDIITNEKYEIAKSPVIKDSNGNVIQNNPSITYLLTDNRHLSIRVDRTVSFDIRVECFIIVPMQVRAWASLGLGLGLGVMAFSILFQGFAGFQYVSALAGGTIAGLFGLRVVLLHDTELLKIWHPVYISLIVLIICTVAGIAVINGLPKPVTSDVPKLIYSCTMIR